MKKLTMLLASTAALGALAFENKGDWKKSDDGALETDGDGNPIYLDGDGKETTVAPGYINRLNTEAAQHRTAARDAQKKLEAFGDLDPKAAKDAVAKMKDVNFDELVNKGEIENVRTQLREQFEADIKERDDKLTDANGRIEKLALNNAFNSSEFLNKRLALPVDAAKATFRDRFRVEGDKVIPLNERGEPLINKHGDVASVDEAFDAYITARSDKDTWLKAPDVGGSGSQGGGGGRGTGNVMKRAEFDALPLEKKTEVGQKAAKGEITISD